MSQRDRQHQKNDDDDDNNDDDDDGDFEYALRVAQGGVIIGWWGEP
jgi:hypothetical protein